MTPMVAAVLLAGQARVAEPPLPGGALLPWSLMAPDGRPSAWKPGRVTVVAAIAYWCETWRPQRESFLIAKRQLAQLPVEWAAISVDGAWSSVDPSPAWGPVLLDKGGKWSAKMGIDRVPMVIVADRSGLIRWTGYGISKPGDIAAAVLDALDDQAKRPGASARVVHATFDDFPAPVHNDRLLAALAESRIKADLFVIGENAAKRPEWIAAASRQGHSLQVHGWRHSGASPEPVRAADWLASQTGTRPGWFRGPGSSQVVRMGAGGRIGSPMTGRIIDPHDALRPGAFEIKRRVLGRLAPGAVIHLHAGVSDTAEALPDLARRIRRLGYEFAPLP